MKRRLALLLATLASLLLRLWGIGFSADVARGRPDEEILVGWALSLFRAHPDREWFAQGWPEGWVGLLHLVQRAQALGGRNLGCLYASDPLSLDLPGRILAALFGTGACWMAGATARRLAPRGQEDAAQIAGILALGVNALAARDAHFAVTDAALIFWLSLSLHWLVAAVQGEDRKLPWAFAAAGAALSFKYAAAPFALPCLAAACLVRKRVPLSCAAAAAGFFLFSPGALFAGRAVLRGFFGHALRFGGGGLVYLLLPDARTPLGGWFHAAVTLPAAMGTLGFALALLGLFACARRDRRSCAVLALSLAAFGLVLAPSTTLFLRYADPLLPPLAAGLGVALGEGLQLCRGWFGINGRAAFLALAAAALLPPLVRTVELDLLLSEEDTRSQAGRWLAERGAAQVVSLSNYAEAVPLLEPGLQAACAAELADFRPHGTAALDTRDWRPLVAAGREGWSALAAGSLDRIGQPLTKDARWAVRTTALFECGQRGREAPALDRCWKEEASFSPGSPACGSYVDVFDAFFAPFTSTLGQERPGPEVAIYRRVCP